jgi:DNA-binding MarR family transcriptional regulator
MDAAIGPNAPILQERLEALLVEVNGLANRLKATDPRVAIPGASRAALQVLQRYGPQTVPQIARARFSSRQNIQIVINRLQQEGLVEFASNPEHKRSALVRLTNRGQAAIAQASAEEAKLSKELLPSFSQTELSSATEVLNKLRKLLDSKEQPDSPAEKSPKEVSAHPQKRGELDREQPKAPAGSSRQEHAVSGLAGADSLDEGELPVSLL